MNYQSVLKQKRSIITLLMALFISLSASAAQYYDFAVDYVFYDTIPGKQEVKVTYHDPAIPIMHDVHIPPTVTFKGVTYKVTTIGSRAFFNGTGNVYIDDSFIQPSNLTTIEEWAFYNSRLQSMILPKSVKSIENRAFEKAQLYELVCPNARIERSAFLDCKSLNKVTLGEGVTMIGNSAFAGCTALRNITLPNSLTTIYPAAFGRSGLVNIVIPDNVTEIPNYAFSGCSSLQNVSIGKSVTRIGNEAFLGTNITTIHIPNNVTTLGISMFANCENLSNFTGKFAYNNRLLIQDNNLYAFAPYGAPECVVPDGVKAIFSAFKGAKNLTKVTLPNTITSIAESTFEGCTALTSVNTPTQLMTIKKSAFSGCGNLASFTLPSTLNEIGEAAFKDCSTIKSFIIPERVIDIGAEAFSGCKSLTDVTLPSRLTNIPNDVFFECKSLKNINVPPYVTNIGDRAFYYCESLQKFLIPNTVTNIGVEAFSNCNIQSVYIGNNVVNIGKYAFYDNYNLATASIGSKKIGKQAFESCHKLSNLTLTNGVDSIGERAFSDNSSLTSVTIPNTVSFLGSYAFEKCTGLVRANISCKRMADNVFNTCTSLTDVTMTDDVTECIDNYTFDGCQKLRNLTISKNIKTIGTGAFRNCYSLTKFECPPNLTNISKQAFQECSGLSYVSFSSNIKVIEEEAFAGCNALTRIDNKKLHPKNLSVGKNPFSTRIYSYCQLNVPKTSLSEYSVTFPWKDFECLNGSLVTCDLNGDGTVNAADVNTLVGIILNGENPAMTVDLGLSVKWANINMGATEPEQYGNYYAWGETEPKSSYSWGTYLCDEKECGTDADPIKGLSSIANTQFDVAHVKWGGTWRMPSAKELNELVTRCEWARLDGDTFYTVTGPNGNSIIIPCTGFFPISTPYDVGRKGYYWAADLGFIDTYGQSLECGDSLKAVNWDNRQKGCAVRAVSETDVNPTPNADMNGDGTVNAADVNTLVGIILQGGE